jgi:hypothetical protein
MKTTTENVAATEPTVAQDTLNALTVIAAKSAAKSAKKAVKKTAAKKAVKPVAKKAVKPVAKKAVKPVAKKAVKPAAKKAAVVSVEPRKSSIFKLATKADITNTFGAGQRAEIAAALRATKGATRSTLATMLPAVKLTNISWHLSMMVADGTATRIAA